MDDPNLVRNQAALRLAALAPDRLQNAYNPVEPTVGGPGLGIANTGDPNRDYEAMMAIERARTAQVPAGPAPVGPASVGPGVGPEETEEAAQRRRRKEALQMLGAGPIGLQG